MYESDSCILSMDLTNNFLSLSSGSNSQTCDIVRRATAVFIFLPTMLRPPQAVEEVHCQETNVHHRHQA